MDLHPPLARLLVTLSAWIGGFDGKFTFYNIGADYLKPNVPYITMRAFTASLGALMAPISYVTLRGIGLTKETSAALTTMIIFENGQATQFRYILLDSYLCFFTSLTAMFFVLFKNLASKPFTKEWKIALVGVGASMALAASCKWVGLFLVAGVGIHTVAELWQFLGDLALPMNKIGRHFMSRAVGLIIIPIAIYATTFYYHFALQTNFNAGAGGMSIEYQQTLHGGELPPTARDVFLGSLIRLRQYKPSGPFLHSHVHMYPEGSKQQQVTGYHHRDQNNLWIFRRPFAVNVTYIEEQPDEQAVDLTQLANGDSIRIQHVVTGRFLHSHPVAPPVSSKEHHYEVSCYGHHPSKYSDPNDNWRIVVCDERGNAIETSAGSPAIPLTAIGTKFRLQHTLLGCYLHTIGKALPQWGFKQNEITCSREALRTNTIWVVELNEHPKMPADMPTIFYPKLSFFGKLIELNRKMWDTNAGLSADHPFASRPMSWPLLSRGIGFWNGNHIPDTEKIHKQKEDLKNGVRPPIQGNPQNGQQLVHVDENGNVVEKNPEEAAAAQGQVVMTPEDQMEAAQLTEALGKFKSCQVYMIGNPLLWWAASGSLLVFVVTLAAFRFATRRGLPLADHIKSTLWGSNLTIDKFGGFFFLQWLFHFLPFFGMNRQLFLHHYFPALHFAVLLFGLLLETVLDLAIGVFAKAVSLKSGRVVVFDSDQKLKMKKGILFILTTATIITFIRFAPLGYGFQMTKSQCMSLKWLPRWDWDCNSLPDGTQSVITTTGDMSPDDLSKMLI